MNRLIAVLIDETASHSKSWSEIADRLRPRSEMGTGIEPHVWAFDYLITFPGTAKRDRFGPLGPRASFESGAAYPPPASSVDKAVVAEWKEARLAVSSPLPQSRYADLLLQVEPNSGLAKAAARAYAGLLSSSTALGLPVISAAATRGSEIALPLDVRTRRNVQRALLERLVLVEQAGSHMALATEPLLSALRRLGWPVDRRGK
jgi:hypothetical protein